MEAYPRHVAEFAIKEELGLTDAVRRWFKQNPDAFPLFLRHHDLDILTHELAIRGDNWDELQLVRGLQRELPEIEIPSAPRKAVLSPSLDKYLQNLWRKSYAAINVRVADRWANMLEGPKPSGRNSAQYVAMSILNDQWEKGFKEHLRTIDPQLDFATAGKVSIQRIARRVYDRLIELSPQFTSEEALKSFEKEVMKTDSLERKGTLQKLKGLGDVGPSSKMT